VLFLGLIGIWCGTGTLLAGHQPVVSTLSRVSHWLVPTVFIAVGVLVLTTSGTLTTTWHKLCSHLTPLAVRYERESSVSAVRSERSTHQGSIR
jgi:hypothetical protein